jgi:hypothetical protein
VIRTLTFARRRRGRGHPVRMAADHTAIAMDRPTNERKSMSVRRVYGNLLKIGPKGCWLVVISILLAACNSSEAPAARESIVLEYVRTSESHVIFRLVNASDRTLYIRGNRTITRAIRTWPGDTGITCRSIPAGRMGEDPSGFGDGNRGRIEVSSGERVRLKIYTTLPQQYRGGRCQLTLRLEDGTAVGPVEFPP